MLFLQYGGVYVFFDDMDIDNYVYISSIGFVMFASLVSISVHSSLVVAVVMCSW